MSKNLTYKGMNNAVLLNKLNKKGSYAGVPL